VLPCVGIYHYKTKKMNPKKIIVTGKKALQLKYAGQFSKIDQLLKKLKAADKKKKIDSIIVYIDDAASAKAAGIKAVRSLTARECKKAIDSLYKKHMPAYIAIVGAGDVIPFVELVNPIGDDDDDTHIPSDLPYACEAAYSTNVNNFTGPARVVARIPDIPQASDVRYLTTVIENCIASKPQQRAGYEKYFAVSAAVWKKSTQMSLHNMFTDFAKLKLSPSFTNPSATHLKAPVHFYNCHGAHNDNNFYGEKGGRFPVAITSSRLNGRISKGCVVAAECCYGAELAAPSMLLAATDTSIANNYLQQNAVAFLGSSTIAYGPANDQGLADLITQYFIINVMNGASTGRALLQARQKFLIESGPQLDPYELKTLAQFLLLGDPAVQPVIDENDTKAIISDTVENRRMKFAQKGADLKKNLAPAQKQQSSTRSKHSTQINQLLKQAGISHNDKTSVYSVKSRPSGASTGAKMLGETDTKFRTFTKMTAEKNFNNFEVLVVKESKEQLLGWKIYVRK